MSFDMDALLDGSRSSVTAPGRDFFIITITMINFYNVSLHRCE